MASEYHLQSLDREKATVLRLSLRESLDVALLPRSKVVEELGQSLLLGRSVQRRRQKELSKLLGDNNI